MTAKQQSVAHAIVTAAVAVQITILSVALYAAIGAAAGVWMALSRQERT